MFDSCLTSLEEETASGSRDTSTFRNRPDFRSRPGLAAKEVSKGRRLGEPLSLDGTLRPMLSAPYMSHQEGERRHGIVCMYLWDKVHSAL